MKSTKQEKIKVIVVNPPTKEESKKRIKDKKIEVITYSKLSLLMKKIKNLFC